MANNIGFWRLKEFVSKHVWESYIVILLFGLPLLYSILDNYYSSHINTENALSLLSVLAQAQAGIIAIVVALILVAVQISAQTYSPRVMDVFKGFKDFWILIAVYGFSIFVDVFVIYLTPKNDEMYINFNIIVNLAFIIAFVAFTALFPFISRTIDMLKPHRIIETLKKEVKQEDIIQAANLSLKNEPEADDYHTLEPIIDIVHKSIWGMT